MKPNKDGAKDSEDSVGEALRPVAKALVKAGVIAYDKLRETVVQANTQFTSIVEEARGEMKSTGSGTANSHERTTERRTAKKKASGGRKKRSPASP
jgi:hypothetical protein